MSRDLITLEPKQAKPSKLLPLVVRGFGGGLNAVEDDVLMPPTDQVVLTNMRRTPSGGQRVRYGSNWFEDVSGTVTGTSIIDMDYFANTIISVTDTGQISATDNDGVSTIIWSSAIAALLPGAPAGWSSGLTTLDFVPFRNQFVIHNGVDKPITIDTNLDVTYLTDIATGSNTNVPIGKYGCVVANYHCVAGISGFPTTVYISSQGTAGTFPGDPAPNDSISIDVGAYAPEGAAEIRGIAGFRSFLIICFQGQTLVVQLGIYDATGNHTPEFPDSMPDFGLLGHRCLIQVENDLMYAGLDGMVSAKRNLFGNLDTQALSAKIEPLFRSTIGGLTDTQILKNCFMVYDKISHDMIIVTPSGSAFVYSYQENNQYKYRSWSTFSGLNITCACTTFLGRVFYASGTRIYQHGNGAYSGEDYNADRLNDRDADWAPVTAYSVGDVIRDVPDETSWTCTVDHISGSVSFTQDRADQVLSPKWEEYLGNAISFVMELPWLASRDPTQTKMLRFASTGTKGTAEFTVTLYVDNLYKDVTGTIQYDPALTWDLIGNDAPGFGYDAGPYGGGRRSDDPRQLSTPLKFKTLKVIYSGSVRKPLEILDQKFLYARGSRQR